MNSVTLGIDLGKQFTRRIPCEQPRKSWHSSLDTLDGTAMTDLTEALANFNFYAAIWKAAVIGERNDHRFLYEPAGDVLLVRGTGERKATQATFIAAPTTGRGAM
ncbi:MULTISPECIES: hypothetical protein [unclassified Burkholderia]|uniref:hypothetical protein n=1 Tax=unclassified Burkholderia TaxID=2613784 RepID=UPI000AFF783C|nr:MULTISPECIES: hypothetical protein [unclassified Burkholderia]